VPIYVEYWGEEGGTILTHFSIQLWGDEAGPSYFKVKDTSSFHPKMEKNNQFLTNLAYFS